MGFRGNAKDFALTCSGLLLIPVTLPLVAAVTLALVHLLAGGLRFLRGTPRSVWLSAAGGVSVAYVFVHVLPELAEGQEAVRRAS